MLENKEAIINYVKKKYQSFDIEDLEILYLKCYNVLVNNLYNGKRTDLPENVFKRYNTWLLDAMIEVINRNGYNHVLSYSENTVSIQFDGTYLSSLISQITPIVRTE